MEHQPETAVAIVCGAALSVTAEELDLAGVEVKDRAAFSGLPQVANLRTITLSKMTFSDAGWESLMIGIKERLNHKWRVKLTDLLHEKYFKNMNYYYIGAGGGRG
eukprot:COSAG05_NODE_7941_length_753_cov_6.923547_1_plen_104_part_10